MIFLIVLKTNGVPIPCSLLKSVAILQCNSRICLQQPNKLRYRGVSEIGYTIKITILAGKMMIFSQWMKEVWIRPISQLGRQGHTDQATDVEFCRCQAQQMTLARYDVARKRAVLNLNEENMGRYGKPDVYI